jgi:hypothetical protein
LINHLGEPKFWRFLGLQLCSAVEREIGEALEYLNARAAVLGVPLEWTVNKSVPWAVVCRAYILSKRHIGDGTRLQFAAFQSGMASVTSPHAFFGYAFDRILGNVLQPALPGRSLVDSVADTFAVGALGYTDAVAQAQPFHQPEALELIIGDDVLHQAALLAVTGDESIWPETCADYSRRRPSWLRRVFTDPSHW